MFNKLKETKWYVIIIFLLVSPMISIFQNFVLFKNEFCLNIWRSIAHATGGLVLPTLVSNLISVFVIVFILFIIIGKLKFKDLCLQAKKIKNALLLTLILWITMNIVFVIGSLVINGSLSWHSNWSTSGILVVFGIFIGQIFGNAFYEEVAFRGFLLPQLYLKLRGTSDNANKRNLILALVLSQSYFSLIHIPNRIANGVTEIALIIQLLYLLVLGTIFALLFLRTKNLFLVIGIHSLFNKPTPLIEVPFNEQIIPAVLMITILIFWPRITKLLKSDYSENIEPKDTE